MEHQLRPRKHACRAARPSCILRAHACRGSRGNMPCCSTPGVDPDSSVSFLGHGGTTQLGNARSHVRQDW